jgi:hypothetical protein
MFVSQLAAVSFSAFQQSLKPYVFPVAVSLFNGTAIWVFTTTVTVAQLGSSMRSISSFTTPRHSYTCRPSSTTTQPAIALALFIDPIKVRDVQLFVDRITEIKSTQFKDNHGISPPLLDDKDQSKLKPKRRISEYSEEPAAKRHGVFS